MSSSLECFCANGAAQLERCRPRPDCSDCFDCHYGVALVHVAGAIEQDVDGPHGIGGRGDGFVVEDVEDACPDSWYAVQTSQQRRIDIGGPNLGAFAGKSERASAPDPLRRRS
jgi:hypothetical protein